MIVVIDNYSHYSYNSLLSKLNKHVELIKWLLNQHSPFYIR